MTAAIAPDLSVFTQQLSSRGASVEIDRSSSGAVTVVVRNAGHIASLQGPVEGMWACSSDWADDGMTGHDYVTSSLRQALDRMSEFVESWTGE